MTGEAEQSIPSRGSHADIVNEAREWLARSRAVKPLPSERIIAGLLERVTLTDAEREAICQAITAYDGNDDDEQCEKIAATLRGLLERLG